MRSFCGFSATLSDFFAPFDTFIMLTKNLAERAVICGVTEIRTRETLLTFTRFPVIEGVCHSVVIVKWLKIGVEFSALILRFFGNFCLILHRHNKKVYIVR